MPKWYHPAYMYASWLTGKASYGFIIASKQAGRLYEYLAAEGAKADAEE